jgi:hypothetical protein
MVSQYVDPEPADASEPVALDTWRRLYELATAVRAMEPWQWMEETDIFGVKDAGNEDALFVSVMGFLGEYHAVAVYPGARAVNEFWHMQEAPDRDAVADTLSAMHYVHAAFGKKSGLEPEEKRRIAELGLTFKGATGWPRFLSFRPGWFPWVVDAREARWLVVALEQLLDVAPRVQKDRRLLGRGGPDHRYLTRVRPADRPQAGWEDTHEPCQPPATTVHVTVPNTQLDALRAMKPDGATVELDVFPSYMPVRERDERPRLPFMMLAVESTSGFVLGFELLMVEGAIEDMWAQVPAKFLEVMNRNRIRPAAVAMRTPRLFTVMEGMCKDLQIEIRPDPELAALSDARQSLMAFNRR